MPGWLGSNTLRRAAIAALLASALTTEVATAAPKRPALGDDPVEINLYLSGLDEDARALREQMKEARREGELEQAAALEGEYVAARTLYKRESARLLSIDRGLVAGGATLVGVGGLSLLTSLGLAIAFAGSGEEAFGWSALATLGGGVLGVAAGAPMLSIGLEKRARQSAWEPLPSPPSIGGGRVVATWSF